MAVNPQILQKLKAWCDRQERCHKELREKLWKEKIYGDWAEEYIAELIIGNYINETRFSQAYVSGKFRIKKWGRNKIIQNLKQKNISKPCISEGLKEIDEEEYLETLNHILEKKTYDYRSEKNTYSLKNKIAKYAMSRGFEGDLVWKQLNVLMKT